MWYNKHVAKEQFLGTLNQIGVITMKTENKATNSAMIERAQNYLSQFPEFAPAFEKYNENQWAELFLEHNYSWIESRKAIKRIGEAYLKSNGEKANNVITEVTLAEAMAEGTGDGTRVMKEDKGALEPAARRGGSVRIQLSPPDDEENKEDKETMAEHIRKYRQRYAVSITSNQTKSLSCGDSVAKQLESKSVKEVYEIVCGELGLDIAETKKKYEHLNLGQQRMCLGNRLRAALKSRSAN